MKLQPQYGKLAWGLALTILDFRILSIDLLADFAGYILMAAALSALAEQHDDYRVAMRFAMVLIFASIPSVYVPAAAGFSGVAVVPGILQLLSLAESVLKLFMVFFMCRAIAAMARVNGNGALRVKAEVRWRGYWILSSVMLFLLPLSMNIEQEWSMLLILLTILVIVMELMIIGLIRKAGRIFSHLHHSVDSDIIRKCRVGGDFTGD